MKAYFTHQEIEEQPNIFQISTDETKPYVAGGPYILKHKEDGRTDITWYGKPGGCVVLSFTERELAMLKSELGW